MPSSPSHSCITSPPSMELRLLQTGSNLQLRPLLQNRPLRQIPTCKLRFNLLIGCMDIYQMFHGISIDRGCPLRLSLWHGACIPITESPWCYVQSHCLDYKSGKLWIAKNNANSIGQQIWRLDGYYRPYCQFDSLFMPKGTKVTYKDYICLMTRRQ